MYCEEEKVSLTGIPSEKVINLMIFVKKLLNCMRFMERGNTKKWSNGTRACIFPLVALFPHHNKWKENRLSDINRTRLTRKYYAACIKCKKPRSFWLVSLDKPSRAKCNHCTPPVPKVKKRRKPLFRNPVIPGPTKVTKKGWCVCPTNSSVAQKCFCFGTLREIKQ